VGNVQKGVFMSGVTEELDRLVAELDAATADAPSQPIDAIDAVLASPPRETKVSSARDLPEVQAFREELVNGLIRVDTANRLLRLIAEVVARL
jgi:hypothetical protein